MEKISEILDNVKDRFASPLIFSFAFSWIVFNWQITVALFWYDPPAISNGHSLIEFITLYLKENDTVTVPIKIALLYTLVYPFVRLLISAFQTLISRLSDALNFRIMKGSKVSMDKYLSLKEGYDKKSATLDKVLAEEDENRKHLASAEATIEQLQNQQLESKRELSQANAFIQNHNNVGLLTGRWIRTLKKGQESVNENIEIQNSNLYVYNGNTMEQKYSIHDFHYDSRNKLTYFTLFHSGPNQNYGFFSFARLTRRHKGFSGIEYTSGSSADVIYTRDEEREESYENEDEIQELTNREYWIKKATEETVKIADEVLEIMNSIKPGFGLKYNKGYIGMTDRKHVDNFVIYRPKKEYMRLELRIRKSSEIDNMIESSGLEEMEYAEKWGRYRVRLAKGDVKKYRETLTELLAKAESERD